jgi:hypothetical protein
MKHIKTYEIYGSWTNKSWAQIHNINVGDYVSYYNADIYHITNYRHDYPNSRFPEYRLENILNDNDKYWSQLSDSYTKLTEDEIKQAKQKILINKFNL